MVLASTVEILLGFIHINEALEIGILMEKAKAFSQDQFDEAGMEKAKAFSQDQFDGEGDFCWVIGSVIKL